MLAELAARGVALTLDGGRLVAEGAALAPDLRAWMAAHRAELLAELLSPDDFEAWSERAAIMEYDGGADRNTAERAALVDVCGKATQSVLIDCGTVDGR